MISVMSKVMLKAKNVISLKNKDNAKGWFKHALTRIECMCKWVRYIYGKKNPVPEIMSML